MVKFKMCELNYGIWIFGQWFLVESASAVAEIESDI